MNETRFQYIRPAANRTATTLPTILVQDAFISGGSQVGLAHNNEDRWELQNYSTWTKGRHILRFGARLRGVSINDFHHRTSAARSLSPAARLHNSTQIIRSFLMKTATRF